MVIGVYQLVRYLNLVTGQKCNNRRSELVYGSIYSLPESHLMLNLYVSAGKLVASAYS
jgi:hypothetical protein